MTNLARTRNTVRLCARPSRVQIFGIIEMTCHRARDSDGKATVVTNSTKTCTRRIEESSESEVENSGFLRKGHRRREMRVGADVYSEYFSQRAANRKCWFSPWSASTAGDERGRGCWSEPGKPENAIFARGGIDVGDARGCGCCCLHEKTDKKLSRTDGETQFAMYSGIDDEGNVSQGTHHAEISNHCRNYSDFYICLRGFYLQATPLVALVCNFAELHATLWHKYCVKNSVATMPAWPATSLGK
ncbi:hypothetical protein B0H13DRAFT_1915876 [Mycena leptocephala]|nr:hypothetical protein B0H13DRAFT_1915876 [Mycena leptocephala]